MMALAAGGGRGAWPVVLGSRRLSIVVATVTLAEGWRSLAG
jgi:hypothetical protein